jgi:hypothetical protein
MGLSHVPNDLPPGEIIPHYLLDKMLGGPKIGCELCGEEKLTLLQNGFYSSCTRETLRVAAIHINNSMFEFCSPVVCPVASLLY